LDPAVTRILHKSALEFPFLFPDFEN